MAALSKQLPRSKLHHDIASISGTPSVPPILPNTAPAQPEVDSLNGATQDFTHPGHTVPPPRYDNIDTLVIVCGHGIFHPDVSSASFPLNSPLDEKNWHLASFQHSNPQTGKPGEHETFVAHILAGLTAASLANNMILVLSGGVTKRSLTPKSESRSYFDAALAYELAQGHLGGGRAQELFSKGRLLLEEYATDSFQNLLFSILLYRQTTGAYPKQIRIITHAFKAKRFLDLHAPAIKWPSSHVQVQGIDPIMSRQELDETIRGEEKFGYMPWVEDPLGTGEALNQKRQGRGWVPGLAKELGEGLEESVKKLLAGTVSENLPWSGMKCEHSPSP